MDQLTSCYFCGAALDAPLEEYPVVPKSLHPDPDDQRTVVLCRGCREKLATVVETVVSAAEADAAADPAPSTTGGSPTDHERPGEVDSSAASGLSDATADPRAAGPPSGSAGGEETATADEDAGPSAVEADADADGSPDETDREAGAGSDDDGPALSALEYNKVMRLLQNREFPVDRDEIRTVAVNAYDIDAAEFDAVIDAAVARGLIAEEDGRFVSGD